MHTKKSNQRTGSRVRPHEIGGAVFRPHDGPSNPEQSDRDWGSTPKRDVRTFSIFGKHDFLSEDEDPLLFEEDDNRAMAKQVWIDNGYPKYYVRRTSDGKLFNPVGIEDRRHNKNIHHATRTDQEFISVNKKVFELYVQFLKTKNPGFLRSAERETF